MTAALDALRAELAHLHAHWPPMPRPYRANTPEGIRYHHEATAHVARIEQVKAEITRLTCPVEMSERQLRPLEALPLTGGRWRR
jgi:hypothetical protein